MYIQRKHSKAHEQASKPRMKRQAGRRIRRVGVSVGVGIVRVEISSVQFCW